MHKFFDWLRGEKISNDYEHQHHRLSSKRWKSSEKLKNSNTIKMVEGIVEEILDSLNILTKLLLPQLHLPLICQLWERTELLIIQIVIQFVTVIKILKEFQAII
uniref:Uncharacterized protein n=1 Tax=Meloidogyne enterolobii TaxID=390850 RepID=A0A6V7YCB8_MELEN|nr:unnamed protein product [Meloidogyne enterolobii]